MKRIGMIGLIGLLVASGCTLRSNDDLGGSRRDEGRPSTAALQAFSSCGPLLDELQQLGETQTARDVGGDAFAVGPPRGTGFTRDRAVPEALTSSADGAEAATAGAAGTDGEWGGTNVQEQGVDEPDTVKTDGNLVLALGGGQLRIVDLSSGAPTQLAQLPAPAPDAQLLVDGTTALVLAGGTDGMTTDLTAIDISAPSAPVVREQIRVDGWLTNARMVDGMVRVVTTTGAPRIAFDMPTPTRAAETTRRDNLDAVRASDIDDWLPRVQSVSNDGRVLDERPAVTCDDVFVPEEPSTTSMVNVISVDLRAGDLEAVDGASVVGVGETVYASTDHLYVTSGGWGDQATGDFTDVHQFGVGGREPASYVASGRVAGWLLNQFSLSEHAGDLRVAVTGTGPAGTESAVVVLRPDGDELVEVGRVDGLGRGEQIRSVRFLGDLGYVVTFRQTDPLYTINLSDPAAPRMVGELKIPGYSSYLHPAGDGSLVGIGQDATLEGQLLGLQVALFDVSDPAAPSQLHKYVLAGATSIAEHDHHALLWWSEVGVLLLPVNDWSGAAPFDGALALSVSGGGIDERARLSHAGAPIERFLVVGDRLVSLSAAGIGLTDPDAFTEMSFTAFA